MFTQFSKLAPEVQAEWIALAGAIGLAIVGGIFNLIQRIHNPGMQQARKKLHCESKVIKKEQQKEGLFFNEDSKLKRRFISSIKIEKNGVKNRRIWKCFGVFGSCLIIGEAGCGKTVVLQNIFRASFVKQQWIRWFSKARESYYLDSENLIRIFTSQLLRESFLNRITQSNLSCLILYVDGIDELSEIYIDAFWDFVREIDSQVNRMVLRASCRTEFANKYLSDWKFDHKISIQKWDSTLLKKLAKSILKASRSEPQLRNRIVEIQRYIESEEFPWNFIGSPLLLKMLLYIRLFGNHKFVADTNKYTFYDNFFQTLISIYKGKNREGFKNLGQELNKAAKIVFEAYLKHEKAIVYMEFLYPLIKPVSSQSIQKVCLCHETFYEYLVARHYHNQFLRNAPSMELVNVMKNVYSNDYADFITAAFAGDQEQQQISAMETMCILYGYTLFPEQAEIFRCKFVPDYKCEEEIQNYIKNLENNISEEQNLFLTLKNEIIFRFGRFSENINKNFRNQVLEFIYFYDTNVGSISDQKYYIAILKRECAISASFLGGEKIELDYIENMLDFEPYRYNIEYDLANRSHTLVYYADIPNSNIYTFKDTEAECSWTYARTKRINRLAYPLPNHISEMNAKERKKYYFRAFDIATIYTFLKSRPCSSLSSEEIEVLTSFKTDFDDMSEERRNLLRKLKLQTLCLIQNRSI